LQIKIIPLISNPNTKIKQVWPEGRIFSFCNFSMGHKELWIKIIEKMSEDLPHAQIITWFKDTAILENMNGVLKVGLPLPFFLG